MSPVSPSAPRPLTRPEPERPAPSRPEPKPPARDAVVPRPGAVLEDLLTEREQAVLDRHGQIESLTYRRDGRPGAPPPQPTGRRIDVRG